MVVALVVPDDGVKLALLQLLESLMHLRGTVRVKYEVRVEP
jgi:hypothetical protein